MIYTNMYRYENGNINFKHDTHVLTHTCVMNGIHPYRPIISTVTSIAAETEENLNNLMIKLTV